MHPFSIQQVKQLLDHCRLFFAWSEWLVSCHRFYQSPIQGPVLVFLKFFPIHFYELDVVHCKGPYFILVHGVIQIKLILVSSNPSEFSGTFLIIEWVWVIQYDSYRWLVINVILGFCDRSKQSNVYQSWKLYLCVSSMPSKMWWQFW